MSQTPQASAEPQRPLRQAGTARCPGGAGAGSGWHTASIYLPVQEAHLPTNLPARPTSSCPRCSFDGQLGLYNLNRLALDPKDGRWRLPATLVAVGRRSIARGDLGSANALLTMAHEDEGGGKPGKHCSCVSACLCLPGGMQLCSFALEHGPGTAAMPGVLAGSLQS